MSNEGYIVGVRRTLVWCLSFELHIRSFCNGATYGVFMQALEARHPARRERGFRDRGYPLDTK